MNDTNHKERAHSKFSASGAERRNRCAFSVEAEEASPPSKDSEWSLEGTFAHEVLEAKLNRTPLPSGRFMSETLLGHVDRTAAKIKAMHRAFGGRLMVEKKVFASFLHPEMFGTCDAIIAGDDGVLHIIDFKYGQGHIVSPEANHQLIQYALSVADSYDWKHFHQVKMWIMQPRAGENWFKSWAITMEELKTEWADYFARGVARVLKGTDKPNPGAWCHWCRAKGTCPAKVESRANKMFGEPANENNEGSIYGEENRKEKGSEEKSSQETRRRKAQKTRLDFLGPQDEDGEAAPGEEGSDFF